ncbi:MAG: phosphoenolpyruvate carboxylase [Planctomycetota bacterium]|nr:phosphoenolpyruvate carboxylase [Planctomycetota bacterium]
MDNELLRRDIRMLGDLLGEVIAELSSPAALELVEEIRRLARDRRAGVAGAEQALATRISELSQDDARILVRAFSVFFDVSNLAEDRHRVRVLRSRQREKHPEPLSESVAAAIQQMHAAGKTAAEVQVALDRLAIELVFTAHPSEAKRRAIRGKLRRMRTMVQSMDDGELLPREMSRLQTRLRTELSTLWQTDFLRPNRPTVLQEVERGLSIVPRIAAVVPLVFDGMRQALRTYYPDSAIQIPRFLHFGSWIGGDRDGNPNVTFDITAQTIVWLRDTAIRLHLQQCRQLYELLTISQRENAVDPVLTQRLNEDFQTWPDLKTACAGVSPSEIYRQWLTRIQWRLQQSFITADLLTSETAELPAGAYRNGRELEADLTVMRESLIHHHAESLAEGELQQWFDLARVFGLHLTRLDVRQDSRRYLEVISELLAHHGVVDDFAALPEPKRQAVLSQTMPWTKPLEFAGISPMAQETLQLFRLLHKANSVLGGETIGGHVISLTHAPSDVLTVLWLWRWAQNDATATGTKPLAAHNETASELRIVPLFEQIGDLRDSGITLDAILSHPDYREHLRRQGNRQIIMVGYSDSTKDGGYLAACWGLYRAQSELHEAASKHGVAITFFHGRGGSLGRGGGPAARGIISLPQVALDGTLRLTEQGEVLAERYDDEQIAFRHLEQVTWATLTGSALPSQNFDPAWPEVVSQLAERSFRAYRELVDQPGFIRFFELATPIEEIENLPIASRPSRRRGERTLADLRAIPWVFSWTQNRCMIPAWYGMGTALTEVKYSDRAAWQIICDMYRQWPFWQATIDNAALAVAKSDSYISQRYSELTDDAEARQRIWMMIASERDRSRQAILDIVGGSELLAATPWFQGSIEVRNPYIDPLNLIQIELLRRRRAMTSAIDSKGTDTGEQTSEQESLRDLLRLTVQGIAAGMRTTG